jgi:hypothetical protein
MGRAIKEESHFDGDHQAVPLDVRHLEERKMADTPGHPPQLCASLRGEKKRTGITGADKLPLFGLDQVLVIRGELAAAHFAALDRGAPSSELPQACQRAGFWDGAERGHS